MKKLAYLLIVLCAISNVAFCVPAKDYKGTEPIIYDVSYNVELFKKLDKAFDKKYIIKETETEIIYNAGANTFQKEVITPYYKLRKTNDEMIQEALAKKKNN